MAFVTSPGTKIAGRMFGPVISYNAPRNHSATVIMLHGLGDTGNGWAPVAPEFAIPHIKWIFPTAPTRPITVNMGMAMPGWFDIDHLDESAFQSMMKGHSGFDPEGTNESIEYVKSLIDLEIEAGIPPERVVVGGFSQGGHVALKTALQYSKKLAGCAAMSTWMEPANFEVAFRDLPIFFGHGTADPLIPAPIANLTLQVLQGKGMSDINFKLYPSMGHSSCPQEMEDLKKFILRVLPDKPISEEDVRNMSAKELQRFITEKGGSTRGLLEKKELLDEALSML